MLREKNALNLLQEHPAIYKILFRSYYYATLCHILLYQYMVLVVLVEDIREALLEELFLHLLVARLSEVSEEVALEEEELQGKKLNL